MGSGHGGCGVALVPCGWRSASSICVGSGGEYCLGVQWSNCSGNVAGGGSTVLKSTAEEKAFKGVRVWVSGGASGEFVVSQPISFTAVCSEPASVV